MVASIGKVASAAASTKYFESDGYYAKDSEAHRRASAWQGKGAETLGLQGNVDSAPFRSILEGHVGETGQRLGRMRDGEFQHKPGTDITFSAPKSVSLAALVGGDKRIMAAHDKAVSETLKYLEKNVLESRAVNPETGKLERVGNQNMVAATFRHEASRNLDPQLHSHAVIANMSQGEDGKWRTIENHSLYENMKFLGAHYRNILASELSKLGYDIEKTHPDGRFELKGLYSIDALDAFSTRSQEIREAMRQLGYTESNPALAARAALLTRGRKAEPDRQTLHAMWRDQAKELGIASKIPFLSGEKTADAPTQPNASEAVRWAIKHLEERNSSFETRNLITAALAYAPGANSIEAIERAIDTTAEKGRLVATTALSRDGFTTDRTLAAEKENIERMINGKDSGRMILSEGKVANALAHTTLTDGQKEAIETTLSTRDKIIGIQGYAGSGKTTMLNTMRAITDKEQAVNIIGLAPSASAAQTLANESGIASSTLQSFLAKNSVITDDRANAGLITAMSREARNTMIVVDEASLASTQQVRDLLKITDTLNYQRVVLVGDVKQLDAVDAGKPFHQLQDAGMTTAVMDEIMRQRDLNLKGAVIEALDGAPAAALERLDKNILETRQDKMASTAATAWLMLSPERREETAIMAPTHQLREEINDHIRDSLARDGIIHGEAVHIDRFDSLRLTQAERELTDNYPVGAVVVFDRDIRGVDVEAGEVYTVIGTEGGQVLMVDNDGKQVAIDPAGGAATRLDIFEARDMELQEGDMIRWTRNDKEHELINNHQAEVVGIKDDMVHFRGEDGREFTLPTDALHHCDYAFNSTVHSFQGRTIDNVIAVLDSNHGELTNQKTFYVEISRARESATLITDDREQLAVTLEYNTGERIAALESIGEEPTEGGKIAERLDEAIHEAREETNLSLAEFEAIYAGAPLPDANDHEYGEQDDHLHNYPHETPEQNLEREL